MTTNLWSYPAARRVAARLLELVPGADLDGYWACVNDSPFDETVYLLDEAGEVRRGVETHPTYRGEPAQCLANACRAWEADLSVAKEKDPRVTRRSVIVGFVYEEETRGFAFHALVEEDGVLYDVTLRTGAFDVGLFARVPEVSVAAFVRRWRDFV